MRKSRQLSIKRIVGLFFAATIALVLLSYTLITLSNNALRTNAATIEVARKAEQILRDIAFLGSVVQDGDREAKEDLKNMTELYSEQLDILRKGKALSIQTVRTYVPPTKGEDLTKLIELNDAWLLYERDIQVLLNESIYLDTVKSNNTDLLGVEELDTKQVERVKNPLVAKAYGNLLIKTKKVQKLNAELTERYIKNYISTQFIIQFSLLVTIILVVLSLVGGYYYLVKRFIAPLTKVANITEEVAMGDVSQRLQYDRRDEIGTLTQNINQLVLSLKQTSEFAKSIGQAQFNSDFKVRSEKDVLGYALLNMRDNLLKVSEEDRRRNWANEGFNRFVEILRTRSEDMEELSYRIISSLVDYLKANQGGLFVVSEEEKEAFLEMKACFAYSKKKFLQKRLEIGQGLIGQAVLEKDTLHLDKIPEDYIEITSGLGDANPKNLLIVPLMDNNEVYGAIEIASFNKFEEYEIDFVEKLAENIASTLAGLKNSQKTESLLLKSQEDTLELQLRDEMMRKNMEELATTQHEMYESQSELQKIKESLEQQVVQRTAELQEKEEQLSEALQMADLAPWKLDVGKQCIVGSEELYRLLRTNHEVENGYEIPTERFMNIFVADDDRKFVDIVIGQATKSPDADYETKLEFKIKQIGGDFRNVALSIKRNAFEDGSTHFLFGTIQDITRQKRIEDRIRQQNEELERQQNEQQKFVAMVENATDFVFMLNQNFEITYANRAGQQEFGVGNFQEQKLHLKDFFDKDRWAYFQEQVMEEVQSFGLWEGEIQMINQRTQRPVYTAGNVVSIKDAKGKQIALAVIVRDITDKHRIEQERELTNTRISAILESTEDEIIAVDADFNILAFNTQWVKFMEAETGQIPQVGMNIFRDFDYKRQELIEQFQRNWTKVFQEGAYTDIEHFMQTEKQKVKVSGKEKEKDVVVGEFFFRRFYNPIQDKEGNTIGAVLFSKDITEQKKAEQELLHSENRLKAITDSTTEGIVIHEKGYIKDVNNAFCLMTGYSYEDLIGKYIFNYLDSESKATAIINMQLGYDKPYDALVVHKDGQEIPVDMQGRVIRFGEQRIRVFSIRNLSDQKEIQKKLQSSKDMLQKIIDTLPQSVFWKDTDSSFLGCNKKFLQTIGYEKTEDIIGKTDHDIWEEAEAEFYVATDKKIMETNMPELDVLQSQVQANGRQVWLRVSKVPFHDTENKVVGIIGTYQDITDQKKNEEAIIESKERLRKQIETLTSLGSQKLHDGNLKDFAFQATESIANTLNIARVSIWEYDRDLLKPLDTYDMMKEQHLEGTPLVLSTYPKFQKALLEEPVILSEFAQVDPRTKELTLDYLAASSITSLLSYPIRVAGKLKGLIACEHIRTPREWTLEEQSFVTSMLDLITIKIEEIEKIRIEQQLTRNNLITEQIIEKSQDSIVALDAEQHIMSFNSRMARTVRMAYQKELRVGMNWMDIFSLPEDQIRMRANWEELMTVGKSFEREEDYGLNEHRIKVRLAFEPLKSEQGEVIGAAVYIRKAK